MESIWLLAQTVLLTPVEPEAVLLNTANGERYVLNPLGTAICSLFQTGSTISDVTTKVKQHFPQEIASIGQDTQEFITQLQSEGLIVTKS